MMDKSNNNLNILYEDNHVICAVKPRGVLSQADDTGAPDMLTILKKYIKVKYNKKGEVYLGLVHRLDRPIGGVMVFARTSKAAARLSEQIRHRAITKVYYAVLAGEPRVGAGLLEHRIVKDRRANLVSVGDIGAIDNDVDNDVDIDIVKNDKEYAALEYKTLASTKLPFIRNTQPVQLTQPAQAAPPAQLTQPAQAAPPTQITSPAHNAPSAQVAAPAQVSSIMRGGSVSAENAPHVRGWGAPIDMSLVRIELLTGRPHQIRAQFAYIGCPVVGDRKYSRQNTWQNTLQNTKQNARQNAQHNTRHYALQSGQHGTVQGRQHGAVQGDLYNISAGALYTGPDLPFPALWAASLAFEHPTRQTPLAVSSFPPDEFPWDLFENDLYLM